MRTAFIFPGQGSQYIGMGKELYSSFIEAREVFQEVDEAISHKLSTLMFNGDIDALTLTQNTQPAIMAVSIAVMRVLQKQGGISLAELSSFIAGHSLGEYSALCAAGVLSLRDTAQLLRVRGNAMHTAARNSDGAMLALLGADIINVEAIVREASVMGICQIANDNGAGQIVLSGHSAAISHAAIIAAGHGVKKAIRLNVSGAFHSELMKAAEKEVENALRYIAMAPPVVPIVDNVTAQPVFEVEEIKALLVRQITAMVRWRESMEYMSGNRVTRFVEVGPGRILSTIAKRMNSSAEIFSLQTPTDINSFMKAALLSKHI